MPRREFNNFKKLKRKTTFKKILNSKATLLVNNGTVFPQRGYTKGR
jgi:uncharacterized membrane protein YcaP (DUF421 family)